MILDIVESVHGFPIRLDEERWYDHIVLKRPYMSGYLQSVIDAIWYPNFVQRANDGSKLALLNIGKNQWLHVIYLEYINDEGEKDGFVSTAYVKSDYNRRKEKIWERD